MITTCELTDQIDRLSQSKEALTEFARRLGAAFTDALRARDVTFHAVNDGSMFVMGNGFDHIVKLSLNSNAGSWNCRVSETLALVEGDAAAEIANVTTLSDSDLKRIADMWADKVAAISKRVVFQNFYLPRAVELCEGYNDLCIAFRIIRAWDVVQSWYVLRIDSVFKNLAA